MFQKFLFVFFTSLLLTTTIGIEEDEELLRITNVTTRINEFITKTHLQTYHMFHPELFPYKISMSTRNAIEKAFYAFLSNDTNCSAPWPYVASCHEWFNETDRPGKRYLLTNHIPTFYVVPYCPFGVGEGYCVKGTDHDECSEFFHMICPAQEGRENTTGDVPVAQLGLYSVDFYPDPTSELKPKFLYDDNPAIWQYDSIEEDFHYKSYWIKLNLSSCHEVGPAQLVGIHITGQQIKGPEEAENINVDVAGLSFQCGGHVTPPVGQGPLWHFHKACTCLMENGTDFINSTGRGELKETGVTPHSVLQGYANDGFGMYGLFDIGGADPVLDECNGHFGPTGDDYNGGVVYHYHARNSTYDPTVNATFIPYWIGCLGPSKGECSSTVPKGFNNDCGPGCGYQLCVQPGTSSTELKSYITTFNGNSDWLNRYTINPY